MSYTLAGLPMGRYIVCGEALSNAKLYQASCFEARVERLDNNCKSNKLHTTYMDKLCTALMNDSKT